MQFRLLLTELTGYSDHGLAPHLVKRGVPGSSSLSIWYGLSSDVQPTRYASTIRARVTAHSTGISTNKR